MRNKTLPRRSLRPPTYRNEQRLPQGPGQATISAILDYSKALVVVDAPPLGKVDLILN